MFGANNLRNANAYQRISVETGMRAMDKHQIVSLLFDGLMEALNAARGALVRKDIPAKCSAIAKCIRILEEGLATGLDTDHGGDIAANLDSLYDYAVRRLILANARNDDAILQEVQGLLEPIAQSWKAIKNPGSVGLASTGLAAGRALVEV